MYQQAAQAAQQQNPGAQPGPDAKPADDGAVDADFHEV